MYQRKTIEFTQACGFHDKKHQKLQKRNIQVKICNLQRIGVSKATWAGTNQRSEFQARHAALTFGCMCVCEPVCVPFLVTAVSVLSSVQDLLTSCNFSIQFQNVFDTYFTWLSGIKSTSMKESSPPESLRMSDTTSNMTPKSKTFRK